MPSTEAIGWGRAGVCRVSDAHLSGSPSNGGDMVRDQDDEELVAVEAELPRELLVEIDKLAVLHGYETPGAVVQEALDRQ